MTYEWLNEPRMPTRNYNIVPRMIICFILEQAFIRKFLYPPTRICFQLCWFVEKATDDSILVVNPGIVQRVFI